MAQHIGVDYNALPPNRYVEDRHISASPCMSADYYPGKANIVPQLQSCTWLANLSRGRASIDQTHKNPGSHEPSLGIRLIVCVVVSFTLVSCIPHAQIVNETATGGTVLYSYVEEQDVLTSPGRKDALLLLGEKCPAGYRISREGEIPRVDHAVDRAWMGQLSRDGQVTREKRWAIQFACK